MVSPISNSSGRLPVDTAQNTDQSQAVAPSSAPAAALESEFTGIPKRPGSPATDSEHSPKRTRNYIYAFRPQQSLVSTALAEINRWVRSAPPDQYSDYQTAARLIRDCWLSKETTSLELKRLSITALPPLPSHLESLRLELCTRLVSPPDVRCCTQLKKLEIIECGSLKDMPDLSQCPQLNELDISGCAFSIPPDLTHCKELKALGLQFDNEIHSAPDFTQCKKLKTLNLSASYCLTTVPDLTQCKDLAFLTLNGCNSLRSPPDLTQCEALEDLHMSDCDELCAPPDLKKCIKLRTFEIRECGNLIEPPDLRYCPGLEHVDICLSSSLVSPPLLSSQVNLRFLDMTGAPLTSLPANLLQLPPECEVALSLGSLSEAVRREFMAAVAAVPENQRPRLEFDMVDATPMPPGQPLHLEAESWRPGSEADWQCFSAAPSADEFSAFLGRIRQTSEYRNERLRDNVEGRVQALLVQLANPDNLALRELCFAQAGAAVTTCDDRIALTLLHLETACSVARINAEVARGDYDQNPRALLKQGAGMYHLRQLEDCARDKVATLRFVDAIEVHLGYLVALSTEFSLPVQMRTMLYPACSNVNEPEIAAARTQLQRCALKDPPDPELVRFLSSWEPLVTQLQRPAMAHLSEGHAQPIEQEVAAEKSSLQQALSQLDLNAESYAGQAQGLQVRYNAVEATVALRRHSAAITRLIARALDR